MSIHCIYILNKTFYRLKILEIAHEYLLRLTVFALTYKIDTQ